MGELDPDRVLDGLPASIMVEWMAFYAIERDEMELQMLESKAQAKVKQRTRGR